MLILIFAIPHNSDMKHKDHLFISCRASTTCQEIIDKDNLQPNVTNSHLVMLVQFEPKTFGIKIHHFTFQSIR